jgi:hypothetical protein
MMYSVGELFPLIKNQAGSAGSCDVEDLTGRMNVIGPELLDRLEANGTVSTWCLCICNSCVVLPSDFMTPLQAWVGGEALGMRGEYWLGRLGGYIPSDLTQEYPWQELVDDGRRAYTQVFPVPATQNDVYEIEARSQADAGKTVEVRYADHNGRQIVWTPQINGNHKPSSPSATGIGDVIRVAKPRTTGALELWIRNLSTGNRILVAVYDGQDEHPEYRLVHITGCASGRLAVKGKRKWLPLRIESDLVPFGRVAVWRLAMMAEAALSTRETDAFNGFINEAVRLLENEVTSLRPKGQAEVVDFVTPFTIFNRRRAY